MPFDPDFTSEPSIQKVTGCGGFVRHCGTAPTPGGTIPTGTLFINTPETGDERIERQARLSYPSGQPDVTQIFEVLNWTSVGNGKLIRHIRIIEDDDLLLFSTEGDTSTKAQLWTCDFEGNNLTSIYSVPDALNGGNEPFIIGGVCVNNRPTNDANERIVVSIDATFGLNFHGRLITMSITGSNQVTQVTNQRNAGEVQWSDRHNILKWDRGDAGTRVYSLEPFTSICDSFAEDGFNAGTGVAYNGHDLKVYSLNAFGTVSQAYDTCGSGAYFFFQGVFSPQAFVDLYFSDVSEELAVGGLPGKLLNKDTPAVNAWDIGDPAVGHRGAVIYQGGLFTEDPLISEGIFFADSTGELRFIYLGEGIAPYSSQLVDTFDKGAGESCYHLTVDQVARKIFTIETITGSRILKSRDYTISSSGVITLGTITTLATTLTSNPNFIERIAVARDTSLLYVGTAGDSINPYTITERNYSYVLQRTIRTSTGTGIRWLAVDNAGTYVIFRRFGIGLDNDHSIRTVKLDDLTFTNYFQPPTSTTTSSHPVGIDDIELNVVYEADGTGIYKDEFPVPNGYTLYHAPGGGANGMCVLPRLRRVAYGEGESIHWRDLNALNDSDVEIWNRIDDGLSSRTVIQMSAGVA